VNRKNRQDVPVIREIPITFVETAADEVNRGIASATSAHKNPFMAGGHGRRMSSLRYLTALGFFAAIGGALAIGLGVSTAPAPRQEDAAVGAKPVQVKGSLTSPERQAISPLHTSANSSEPRSIPRCAATDGHSAPSGLSRALPGICRAAREKPPALLFDIAVVDKSIAPLPAKLRTSSRGHSTARRWPMRTAIRLPAAAPAPIRPCPKHDAWELARTLEDVKEAEPSRPPTNFPAVQPSVAPIHCLAVVDPSNRPPESHRPDIDGLKRPGPSSPRPAVREIDLRPPRVAIETLTVRVELDRPHRAGVDLPSLVDQAGRELGSEAASIRPGNGKPRDPELQFDVVHSNAAALLEALKQVGHPQIIAAPRFTVLDDHPVEMCVGEQVGRAETSVSPRAAGLSVAGLNTGTRLRLRSWISSAGMLHMEVRAELSSAATPEKPYAGRSPKRKALTAETMIPEGSTLVLRGPVHDVQSSTSTEVPVLGRLPLVGKLFRATATTTRRCELLVLITPHIVGPQDDHVVFHDAPAGSMASSAGRSIDPRVQFVQAVLADSEIPTAAMVRRNARDRQRAPASDTAWQTPPIEAVGEPPGPLVNFSARPLSP
jgi:hypothetical protein